MSCSRIHTGQRDVAAFVFARFIWYNFYLGKITDR